MNIMRDDITAKILASSIDMKSGTRVDSLQLRYPRIIHAEFMTHRVFSRNASSSRAIPVASMTNRDEMFVPKFKYNKAGMQPAGFLTEEDQKIATEIWQEMADFCLARCRILGDKHGLNVAKQWANRPLEWFGYIDVVLTSTDWANWDYLRDHGDAQDEICVLARKIGEARNSVKPTILGEGQWHMPYIRPEDINQIEFLCDPKRLASMPPEIDLLRKSIFASNTGAVQRISNVTMLLLAMSAARCCRVSYAKHDGEPTSLQEDVERCMSLVRLNSPAHASPFEHQATAWNMLYHRDLRSNLRNLLQLRKLIPFESIKDKN